MATHPTAEVRPPRLTRLTRPWNTGVVAMVGRWDGGAARTNPSAHDCLHVIYSRVVTRAPIAPPCLGLVLEIASATPVLKFLNQVASCPVSRAAGPRTTASFPGQTRGSGRQFKRRIATSQERATGSGSGSSRYLLTTPSGALGSL